MKKTYLSITSLLFLLFSVSCNNSQGVTYTVLMPSGAPTIAIAEEVATNKNVTVTTNTNEVKDNFVANNYSYLVFDAINGITFERNGTSNYEFVTLLTGGNFHLIGLNKTSVDEMKDEDFIVGFGNGNLIPNKVYNKLFSEAEIDFLLPNITDLKNYLSTIDQNGSVNNTKIDWIFIAQPALFALKSSSQNFASLLQNSLDINIREYFGELYDMDYIPQAGLFVNKTFKENNPQIHAEFINKVSLMKEEAISNPSKIKEVMHNYNEDLNKQTERYGFNENIAYALQNDNNQFGVVNPNDNIDISYIDSFLELL